MKKEDFSFLLLPSNFCFFNVPFPVVYSVFLECAPLSRAKSSENPFCDFSLFSLSHHPFSFPVPSLFLSQSFKNP
ncbi:hypothetical protein H7K20_18615 [Priestia aryabhattai]|nr:hypothetical protein [Priestia aryabhattai]